MRNLRCKARRWLRAAAQDRFHRRRREDYEAARSICCWPCLPPPWLLVLGLHKLDIERDGHIVADKNATSFECRVPDQAEVFPVDLGRSGDCDAGVAPGI